VLFAEGEIVLTIDQCLSSRLQDAVYLFKDWLGILYVLQYL
jgi:hypothetical protein